jgi:hypothetical protein
MNLQYWQELVALAAGGGIGGAIYWAVHQLDTALARVWPDKPRRRR